MESYKDNPDIEKAAESWVKEVIGDNDGMNGRLIQIVANSFTAGVYWREGMTLKHKRNATPKITK